MKPKLTVMWLIWFVAACAYSYLIAGAYFRHLFSASFDKRLQEDMVKLVQTYKPGLAKGLQKKPDVMTMDELDVIEVLAKDKMVTQVAYFNKFGRVRWHRQASLIGLEIADYEKSMGRSEALWEALNTKTSKIRSTPDGQYYEIAVPFYTGTANKDLLGALWLQVTRKYVDDTVAWGMGRYRLGAAVVALLFGGPLYVFMYLFIIKPVERMQEGLDALSLKNLEWKVALRKDEFGELATGLGGFIEKVRGELTTLRGREAARASSERQWWGGIFAVMGEGRQAIVVDEDNNVLFTNIPIAGPVPDRMHLLDVIDNQQQDILRLVGVALERPNDLVQGETLFQNKECKVRIVHLGDTADLKRTLIYFEPKRQESEFQRT